MKRLLGILVTLVLVLCLPITVFAAEDSGLILQSDAEVAARGASFRLSVSLGESLGEVSAFRARLSYDASYLTLTKVERSALIRSEDYWCRYTADGANLVFASADRPLSSKSGVCFTLVFDVNEDAAVGNANVLFTMDQIVRENQLTEEAKVSGYSIEMERILSTEALLTKLNPSTGTLTPNFSPEVTEYTMTVPYEVKELTFDATAKDGGTVRVNRKNLNKAGEATTYIIKVTSEDGKSVTEYVITATRQPKEVASSQSSSGSSTGTTGTIGRVPSASSSRRSSTASSGRVGSSGRVTGRTSGRESASSSGGSAEPSGGTNHEAEETGNKTVIVNGNRNVYNNSNPYMAYGIGILVGAGTLAAVVIILYGRKRSHTEKHRDSDSNSK